MNSVYNLEIGTNILIKENGVVNLYIIKKRINVNGAIFYEALKNLSSIKVIDIPILFNKNTKIIGAKDGSCKS